MLIYLIYPIHLIRLVRCKDGRQSRISIEVCFADASNPGLDSSKITFLGALEFGNRRECWDIIVKTSPNDIKSLYNTR
eukprot:1390888-Amorphochlora_amoeboformis.AAC.2